MAKQTIEVVDDDVTLYVVEGQTEDFDDWALTYEDKKDALWAIARFHGAKQDIKTLRVWKLVDGTYIMPLCIYSLRIAPPHTDEEKRQVRERINEIQKKILAEIPKEIRAELNLK